MSAGAESQIASVPPKPVNVAAIERELGRLWDEPTPPDAAAHVTRACMSNLVVLCGAEADALALELPAIVRQHPARILLLATVDNQRDDLEAFVSAQCYLGSGGRQVCSEHVMVQARAAAMTRLPSIVRPLLIGDLPTTLWWAAGGSLAGDDLFEELIPLANQLVYDSAAWGDALPRVAPSLERAFALLHHFVVADLAWHRLQPWLHLISETLDPGALPGALESISEISIEHGARGLPPALLLAGWLASRLGWHPTSGDTPPTSPLTWTLQSAHGGVNAAVHHLPNGEEGIRTVTIRYARGGRVARLRFAHRAAGFWQATADGIEMPERRYTAPVPDRAALVAQQLSELGRNTLFQETLTMARQLAGTAPT